MGSLSETPITTKALVVEKPGAPFVVEDVVLDKLRDNELLVDIKYAGLCHTDLVIQHGKMPIGGFPVVAGHEGAGIIVELGRGLGSSGLKVGDRVLLGFASCMSYRGCEDGSKGACDNIALTNFGGTRGLEDTSIRRPNGAFIRGSVFGQSSFSKLAVCDVRAAVKYPGPVEDLAFLAPLGCGFMTGAGTLLDVLKPKTSNSVAILGLGAVGLTALMAAKSLNVAEIIAIDIVESRLELAKSLGATHALNGKSYKDVEAAIRETAARGVDFIVDTTGATSMINSGIKALAQQGTFAIVGTPVPGEHLSVEAMDMLIHCKKIIGVTGAYANPQELIPRLVKMHQDGLLPIEGLCKSYPPTDIDQAINDMKSGKVIKPVLAW
ncbi:putative alcohol dehydrogenase [Exophiala viscosa]|uniref:Alcohol dehydrogenase n=1 Tax=Exophiala viscosa TaxID=2486360 RepID=A0AAN6E3Z0_9EURO|nr:putative alcohol dehydrogenase [Exophiala viscosa]